MRSPERRFTWALIAGALVTGIAAPHTNAPFYNFLIGLAWGVPVWIATWAVLETLNYLQETRDEQGKRKPPRPRGATVHVMYGHDREVDQ